ncbi:MAG: RHS repeat-associated core domain-containing protein [Prevotellaceae bacterium]|nr:RHS repeat-associated core domain-containing protein [Prevotellaceae bacterium]
MLKTQISAKNDVTTMFYDRALRDSVKIIQQAETETTPAKEYRYLYSYVQSGSGVGQIDSVALYENDILKHSQKFTYNSNHTVLKKCDFQPNIGFVENEIVAYDNLWRPIKTQSPSGMQTEYSYDKYGNIDTVMVDNSLVWTLTNSNSRGQITGFKTGNGTNVEKNYLPNRLLSSINSHKNDNEVQNLSYQYDKNYNLIQRNNHKTNHNEVIRYDKLNRLTSVTLNDVITDTILYENNGNIITKNDVGTYLYELPQPNAVSGIEDGTVGDEVSDILQILTYNAFNKVTSVSQDSVTYLIDYGFNRQRIKSVFSKIEQQDKERFYFGNLEIEIEIENGDTTYIDYIRTPVGLTAIRKTKEENSDLYYVYSDNLGSVQVITDTAGNIVNEFQYTVWGGRTRIDEAENPDITDRGYTAHEHLTALNIINMNGRIYDPVLARFLSPDPYVQAPDFTQSFNRYAYCLNNPFKYTDPSGEIVWFVPILVAAAVFAVGNTTAHAIRGDIHNFGDGLKYFAQGAIVGAALGATWQFAPLIPYIGQGIQTAITYYGIAQVGLGVAGTVAGAFNDGWKGVGNGSKAFLGNFYMDENNWFGGVAQGFLRHTWEMPQSLVGHGYTQIRNIGGNVDRVDYLGGATFATNENSDKRNGVSIGNYININIRDEIMGSFDEHVLSDPLFMHEYGHTIDSRAFGLSYLFAIGIPSIISAGGSGDHSTYWTEKRANKRAKKYFERYYGIDWNIATSPYYWGTFEYNYPTN